MRLARSGILAAAVSTSASAAGGQPAGDLMCPLKPYRPGVIAKVLGPTSFELDGSRERVRLTGLWHAAPGSPEEKTLSEAATAYLRQEAEGHKVRLFADQQRRNRFGEHLAHVLVEPPGTGEAFWLQGSLLSAGLARVYTLAGTETLAAEMLAIEQRAREEQRGLWWEPYFAVRTAENAARVVGGFHIVRGRVAAVAVTGSRIYLNFDDDWRTDFTVMIERKHARRFQDGLRGLRELGGRQVRVRGWVFSLNGPAVRADHGAALEILSGQQ